MILNVFFASKLAGTLESTPDRGVIFQYDEKFLKSGTPLSQSMPLRMEPFSQQECLPFFSGILPEGDVKRRVSDFLHVSETSTLKLLQELGGDCAGIITILPENESNTAKDLYTLDDDNYEELPERELLKFIQNINVRPLLKAKEEMRLSLAGAQEKLPLAYLNGKYYLPKNGAPSTHIIKPTGSNELSTLAANEYICIQLARLSGLSAPKVELRNIGDTHFLMVERYDRNIAGNKIRRLHQEDMCQAQGIMSDRKYQNDGGPSIASIYNFIKDKTTVPILDTRAFIQYILFNLIIGNCDAHGKNYSLLYDKNTIKLAPIYDTVCTLVYPSLTNKTSMKVGKHYETSKINSNDLAALANEIDIRPATLMTLYKDIREKIFKGMESLEKDPHLTDFTLVLAKIKESIVNRDIE